MALTKKGQKIRRAMRNFYGKQKGDSVFSACLEEKKFAGVGRLPKKVKKNGTTPVPH